MHVKIKNAENNWRTDESIYSNTFQIKLTEDLALCTRRKKIGTQYEKCTKRIKFKIILRKNIIAQHV